MRKVLRNKRYNFIYLLCIIILPTNPVFAADDIVLPTVEVTSTRTDTTIFNTPASVDIVEGSDIRNSKLEVNLSESLQGVAGVQIQNRNNYAQDLRLSIRGAGARSAFGVRGTRIYVDGIPASMPDGQGQISNIDLGSVDHIEVLKGPFSSLYGNSSGGVIQIFTEEGTGRPTLEGSTAAGSFNSYRNRVKGTGSIATETGSFNYTLSASHFSTTGYRHHSDTQKKLQNAKFSWQIDPDRKITFVLNNVNLKAQDPLGVTREQYKHDPRNADRGKQFDTRKRVTQTQGGLLYEQNINDTNELRAMVYYGFRDNVQYQSIPFGAQLSPGHAGSVIDFQRNYGGADLRWTSHLSLADRPFTLISGISYDLMKDNRKGYENYLGTWANPIYGEKGRLRRKEDNTLYNLDPYLQASWQFANKWKLDAGTRYSTVRFKSDDKFLANGDDSGSKTYHRMLPMAALSYAITPDINIYASYAKGFETPTFTELSYRPDGDAGLNLSLSPAVSDNYELGTKFMLPRGMVTASLFQINTKNEIITAGSIGGRSTYRNGGKTRRNGFELAWNNDFTNNITTQLSYTWIDAYYRDNVSADIRSNNYIPGIAKQTVYGAIAWKPKTGWYAGIDGQYMSKIYVTDSNSESAPSYFLSSAYTGYTWQSGKHWTLNGFVRIDNLLDRRYVGSVVVNERNGYFYEPGAKRNWLVGATASFTF